LHTLDSKLYQRVSYSFFNPYADFQALLWHALGFTDAIKDVAEKSGVDIDKINISTRETLNKFVVIG
jgi:hypothetical protein